MTVIAAAKRGDILRRHVPDVLRKAGVVSTVQDLVIDTPGTVWVQGFRSGQCRRHLQFLVQGGVLCRSIPGIVGSSEAHGTKPGPLSVHLLQILQCPVGNVNVGIVFGGQRCGAGVIDRSLFIPLLHIRPVDFQQPPLLQIVVIAGTLDAIGAGTGQLIHDLVAVAPHLLCLVPQVWTEFVQVDFTKHGGLPAGVPDALHPGL